MKITMYWEDSCERVSDDSFDCDIIPVVGDQVHVFDDRLVTVVERVLYIKGMTACDESQVTLYVTEIED